MSWQLCQSMTVDGTGASVEHTATLLHHHASCNHTGRHVGVQSLRPRVLRERYRHQNTNPLTAVMSTLLRACILISGTASSKYPKPRVAEASAAQVSVTGLAEAAWLDHMLC